MLPGIAYAQIDISYITGNQLDSAYDFMLFPDRTELRPDIYGIGSYSDPCPFGCWGEPLSTGAFGHFYGLGTI